MRRKENEIKPLNETILIDISIDELESRLQMEELNIRGEMWTGCGCASICTGHVSGCPPVVSGCPPVCPTFGVCTVQA